MAFPQFRWAVRAVQYEHSLAISCDDVDMSGAVIVNVYHDAQAIEAKDSWHW